MDLPSSHDPEIRGVINATTNRIETAFRKKAEHVAMLILERYLKAVPNALSLPVLVHVDVPVTDELAALASRMLAAKGWNVEFEDVDSGWRNVKVIPA